jgi:hypothetical protein
VVTLPKNLTAIREEGKVSGAFYRPGKFPLMLCTNTSLPTGTNFAFICYIAAKLIDLLIVEG